MVGDLECHINGEWYCSEGTYWYTGSQCNSENGPCYTPSFEPDIWYSDPHPLLDLPENLDEGSDPGVQEDPGTPADSGMQTDLGKDVEEDANVQSDVQLQVDSATPADLPTDEGTDLSSPVDVPAQIDVTPPVDTTEPQSNAPWGDNLIVNGGAETQNMSGWTIIDDGGDGWTTSTGSYAGSHSVRTSYGPCLKAQTIDLLAAGFTEEELDNEPEVLVSEWFSEYYASGDIFKLRIELRDANDVELATWVQNGETAGGENYADDNWFELTHTITNYGPGLRKIYFEDGGQDGEYWSGHYGIRLDEASVILNPSTE